MRGPSGRWSRGAALLIAALLCGAAPAAARQGDSRAGLFIGTTTQSVDQYTTFGTTFGGQYGYEFQDDLLWTLGGSFASTEGTAIVNTPSGPMQVDLRARTAAFQTGLLTYFNRQPSSLVIPFAGGGISFLNYSLEYPNTVIGTTSGTGPGAYVSLGVELRLTSSLTLIPELGLQVHTIKTQSGDRKGLLSGGLIFTLRIST
jgi:Outer membrane protein beta-barrel domain